MIDIYDGLMNFLYTSSKEEAHDKGLWHKVVSGVFYNKKEGKIYMQTNYPKVSHGYDRPDYIDFTVNGHVEEGEDPLLALIRETKEEIGFDTNVLTGAKHIFTHRIITDPCDTKHIREFEYVYAVDYIMGLEGFTMKNTDSEIKSIIELGINQFIRLLTKELDVIYGIEKEFDKETRKHTSEHPIEISRDRILPDLLQGDFLIDLLFTLKSL